MKKLINLPFITELDARLRAKRPFIQVLLGPRQVGKTTSVLDYLKNHYSGDYIYESVDLLDQKASAALSELWNRATNRRALLVIDEIQKLESWADLIKGLWDRNQSSGWEIQVLLLGSSSLDLHLGLNESLTGRFQITHAHHWNARESAEGYGLSFEEFLKYGGYPGSYPLISRPDEWAHYLKLSIVDTVVDRDILRNHTVKSPALFRQTFDLVSSYPAQEISYTKLLGQIQEHGNTDLIRHYIRLFEGAFLIRALHKFSTNPIKKKSSSPKLLPLCPAFYFLTILGEYRPDERERAFELLVGTTLNRLGHELYYWRDRKYEVDFVLKIGKKIFAIEVKSGKSHANTKGLDAFLRLFPNATPHIITPQNYLEFEANPLKFLGVN